MRVVYRYLNVVINGKQRENVGRNIGVLFGRRFFIGIIIFNDTEKP